MPRALLCCLLLAAALTTAAPVPEIHNGPAPRDGVRRLRLQAEWRLGGENDEDAFFGVVDQAALDDEGRVLLADIQLMQVTVVDPSGAVLGVLGRQGEGPGEVTRLGGVLPLSGDRVGLIQMMPGRVVMVDREGLPAGDITPRWGESGGRLMLAGVQRAGDLLVAAGRRMVRRDEVFNLDLWIAPLAEDGSVGNPLYHVERERNLASRTVSERDGDWAGEGRWTVTAAGLVILAPERNEYRLEVHGPGGLESIFSRPFVSRPRTDAEKEAVEARFSRFRGRGGRRPADLQVEVLPTVPDILALHAMPDGELWVRTSRSAEDQPAGVLLTYDVFDPQGNFIRQTAVECEGLAHRDALFPLGGGRFVLIKGHAEAMAAMRGTETDDADAAIDDAAPLEIVGLRAVEQL